MLPDELLIDNFAGGGGASTGIELALGRPVDLAINHDPVAIALHQQNHPRTRHCCEDVFKIDPVAITEGRRVGLAWFSPDCKHFSKAKGGKPRSKKIRGLAWVAIKWADLKRPRIIILENVEEFEDWGPLLPDGRPCPERKGRTFKGFVKRLQNIGYQVEWRELRACDYGAPTIRKRLFLIARCDGRPIVWPAPTHADPAAMLPLKPWRIAAECIDWSIPSYSIFLNRREACKLGIVRPLAKNTMRRLARGVFKFVISAQEPFLVSITHRGSDRVEPLSEPLRTITGAHRGEKALAVPFLASYHSANRPRGERISAPYEPLRTQDTSNRFALVAAFLTKFYGTNIGQRLAEPLHSVTAQGNHIAKVHAFLVKYYGCGDGQSLSDPIHTIPTLDRFALVTVGGEKFQIADIGMRMLAPRELYRGQGFPDSYIIDLEISVKRSGKLRRVPLSGEAKVRLCGNSVCPPVAQAIVAANCL